MMNWILTLSIAVNVILAVFVIKQETAPKYEKLIIESHASLQDEVKTTYGAPKRTLPPATSVPEKTEGAAEGPEPFAVPAGEDEMAQTHERMETERTEFLTRELALEPQTVFEYQRLRNEYFEQTSQMWQKNPYGELSFANRRKMLDMEEKLHQDLTALLGKENWQRYQKFREDYNKRGFERQVEENQPFLFMGL